MAKVVIPVTADTSEAEQNVKEFVKTASNEKVEFELTDVVDKANEQEIKRIDLLTQKYQQLEAIKKATLEYANTKTLVDMGGLKPEILENYKSQINSMAFRYQQINNELSQINTKTDETTSNVREQVQEEKQVGNEIDKNKGKQEGHNNKTKEHSFHLKDIIKKLTRWGLALVGIRSAYTFLRGAVSQVASRNAEIGAKMQQMKNVLYNSLTPIVQVIVNLLMKAMVYVNYITKALFGKAIFDFSSATKDSSKGMSATEKSAEGTAKALKDANKQLAGFDEMTVLTDNASSGGGGGSSGGVGGGLADDIKNMFDDLKDLKVPTWLNDVANALKPVVEGWKTIIWSIKEKQRLDQIEKDNEAGRRADNKKRQQSLEKQGTQIIKNTKAQKQMTDQEFIYIRGIEDEIVSLSKKGKLTDAEKERLRILTNRYGDLYREGVLNNSQMEMYRIIVGKTKVAEKDRAEVLDYLIDQSIDTYNATKNLADADEQVAQSTKDGNIWVNQFGITLETMGKKAGLTAKQTDEIRSALNKFDKSDKGFYAMVELDSVISKVGKEAGLSKEQIQGLINKISGLQSKKITIDTTLTVSDIKEKIKGTITNGLKKLFGAKGMVIGYNKGGIVKYAKGGIINRPSRGVPLPLGGEHGMEGVVPLTDSQQMQLLGKAIGEFITINANITNTMNGRIISKELQKIQNDEAFGSNRW